MYRPAVSLHHGIKMMPKTGSPRPTHFLSIPILTPSSIPALRSSLQAFKADCPSSIIFNAPYDAILSQASAQLPPDDSSRTDLDRAIRPLGTLHVTLGAMRLETEERLKKAVSLLESLDLQSLLTATAAGSLNPNAASADMRITLKGLFSMHKSTKTNILYVSTSDSDTNSDMTTTDTGRFEHFCQSLHRIFQDEGLILPSKRPLILHVTVFNTVYLRPKSPIPSTWKHNCTVNATEMLRKWDSTVWGEVDIEAVQICQMGATKVDGELGEAYSVVAERKIR
jgi:activating signal cointegrator complex subunit 1